MKLSHRISLFSTFFLLILLVLVNMSIYFVFENQTTDAELNRAVSRAHTIVEAIRPTGLDSHNPSEMLQAYVPGDGMVRVIRENGRPIVAVTKELHLNEMEARYTNQEQMEKAEFGGLYYAVVRTPVIWSDGSIVTLEVYEPMVFYEEAVSTLQIILIVASLLIIVPSFFAGRALSKFILQPIKALVATMNEIREQGTFKKIEVREQSKDELDQMGISFNHMMDLLKKNFERQQQFVSDASHELKTPLTVIESYARLLKRWGMQKPDVLEEAVEAIFSESQRMKEMTNQMLALATDDSAAHRNVSPVELKKIVEETAHKLEVAFQRNINVHSQWEQLMIQGDEGKLKQLLFILLENGLKYSDEKLDVVLTDKGESVEIAVKDYGVGIPEEDIPRVFERFFRVDKARSRKTGGSGLGLAIAKGIVDVHRGDIRLESEEGDGTTFFVTLPKGKGG